MKHLELFENFNVGETLYIYEKDSQNYQYIFKYKREMPEELEYVSKNIEFYNQNANEIIFTD